MVTSSSRLEAWRTETVISDLFQMHTQGNKYGDGSALCIYQQPDTKSCQDSRKSASSLKQGLGQALKCEKDIVFLTHTKESQEE